MRQPIEFPDPTTDKEDSKMLPIAVPGIHQREVLEQATVPFRAPFGVSLLDDVLSGTPLQEIVYKTHEDDDFASLHSAVLKDIKTSYDVDPSGGYSGALIYNGIAIWECNHHHSKPEYNRRYTWGWSKPSDSATPWAASATLCATRALEQFQRMINGRGDCVLDMHIHGTPGLFALSAKDITTRLDHFKLTITSGMDQTSFYLRIWNSPEHRVLYVCQLIPDPAGTGRERKKMLVGYIDLDDPSDTTGRPDPSLFTTPASYRRWLRAAAWAYGQVWGDAFRSQLLEDNYQSLVIDESDVDPKVPKRAAEYFKPARTRNMISEVDKAPKVSIKQAQDTTHRGWWIRTNRSGRHRTFTIMFEDTEGETFTNRGAAAARLEELKEEST